MTARSGQLLWAIARQVGLWLLAWAVMLCVFFIAAGVPPSRPAMAVSLVVCVFFGVVFGSVAALPPTGNK